MDDRFFSFSEYGEILNGVNLARMGCTRRWRRYL